MNYAFGFYSCPYCKNENTWVEKVNGEMRRFCSCMDKTKDNVGFKLDESKEAKKKYQDFINSI